MVLGNESRRGAEAQSFLFFESQRLGVFAGKCPFFDLSESRLWRLDRSEFKG